MATPPITAAEQQTVRGALLLLQQLLREQAHGQLIITVRDGKIQLLDVRRTYLPGNLPGAGKLQSPP